MKKSVTAIVLGSFAILSTSALAGEEFSGVYKRPNGNLVEVAACGTAFCVTSQMPATMGRPVGKLAPDGKGGYQGSLTDIKSGKTYSGKARLAGSTLTVAGCVLGGLVCKSENWLRQP
jgi:uncharacterized protein (DUF2147 family)